MIYEYKNNENKSGIYKIKNIYNGREYIGQTKCFKERWKQHSFLLKKNKHPNKFLQNDFNKIKEEIKHDNFLVFEIIEVMDFSTKKERNYKEELEIAKCFDNCKNCYNIKEKVIDTERKYFSKNPEESIKKISKKLKEIKGTKENRQKVSSFMKEYKNSYENKIKASEIAKNLWNNQEYRKNHKEAMNSVVKTIEYKQKQKQGFLKKKLEKENWIESQKQISLYNKANIEYYAPEELKKKLSEEARKNNSGIKNSKQNVYEIIDPFGKLIKIFNIKDFCKINNLDYNKFRSMVLGRRKEFAGFYTTQSRPPRISKTRS
jgi:hypothetical protein